ncbi:MAG: hypothetical protein M1479_10255 [Actinobacteria bacterium]|nr:hypothetical protein [Cyanobacteriota bacterium]MCL4386426.1 hypothetical protein [Cyanobacteriota bacterium]MCL5771663.1 hypothetical protein [Actinomycetota bacterium]MCL5772634.1 hypothetical protein [Actinomycetota bacterium]
MKDKLKVYNKETPIPEELKPILWSKNINNLDPETDKIYIIHQVLAYGNIDDIKILKKIYSDREIENIFKNFPKRIYTRPVFLFIKNFMLNIDDELNEKDYVKSFT